MLIFTQMLLLLQFIAASSYIDAIILYPHVTTVDSLIS